MERRQITTLADVLAGGEERLELVKGVPYMMAPPSWRHQAVSGAIFAQLHNFLEGKRCKVFSAPFGVRLFEREGEDPGSVDTLVEPDITVICDTSRLDKYGFRGAPDMVAEVLSTSTRRRDRLVKSQLYQQAGVMEYWIVDPVSRTVEVYLLEEGRYQLHEVYSAGDIAKVHVLSGCFIELSKVFSE